MIFEPMFDENNEVIGFTDDLGNEWSLEEADTYWSITGNSPYQRSEQDAYDFIQQWGGW